MQNLKEISDVAWIYAKSIVPWVVSFSFAFCGIPHSWGLLTCCHLTFIYSCWQYLDSHVTSLFKCLAGAQFSFVVFLGPVKDSVFSKYPGRFWSGCLPILQFNVKHAWIGPSWQAWLICSWQDACMCAACVCMDVRTRACICVCMHTCMCAQVCLWSPTFIIDQSCKRLWKFALGWCFIFNIKFVLVHRIYLKMKYD